MAPIARENASYLSGAELREPDFEVLRPIRRRSMRRDREDELDLADIGGEAYPATHGCEHSGAGARAFLLPPQRKGAIQILLSRTSGTAKCDRP
jgi:hypothetical protein